MTPSRHVVVLIIISWLKGVHLSKDQKVSQTPTDLIVKPNQEVQLSFTHNIPNYDAILWYQRSPGDSALKLIGYMYYKSPTMEPAFEGHFKLNGDGTKSANLSILKPRHPEDVGEYFGVAWTGSYTDPTYFGQGTKLTVLGGNRHVKPPTVNLMKPSKVEFKNQKDNRKKKTLVCVASEFYPDHISVSWERNGEEVTDGVATDTAALRPEGEKYYKISSRLRVSAETWFDPDTQFKCIVKFFNGTSDIITTDTVNGESEAHHQVTPPTVKLIKPSGEECSSQKDNGRNKTLVCVASEFYPEQVSVSWEQNEEEVTDGVATDALQPQGEQYYKISSRLTVSADTWFNPDTQFTCIVKFYDGENYINEEATVNGEPAPVKHSLTREKYLNISQSAKLSYGVFIAKSCVYCAFVGFQLYRLQRSAGKLNS